MGIANVNQIIVSLSTEKTFRSDFDFGMITAPSTVSVAAAVDLSNQLNTHGARNTYPGANLQWVSCNSTTSSAYTGIPHAGNVGSNTQIVTSIVSPAPVFVGTGPLVGGFLILADLQGYWPNVNFNTTTTQSLGGTPTLRYENGNGCRLYLVTTATAGASAQNVRLFYYDQAGIASNSDLSIMRASSVVGQMPLCDGSTAQVAPFFRLASGDIGISNCANITFTATNTGSGALCLARPLAYIPYVTAAGVASEREFIYQTPIMPIIKNDACLVLLFVSALGGSGSSIGAATKFFGHIETVWG